MVSETQRSTLTLGVVWASMQVVDSFPSLSSNSKQQVSHPVVSWPIPRSWHPLCCHKLCVLKKIGLFIIINDDVIGMFGKGREVL